jgi:hypothetical protein
MEFFNVMVVALALKGIWSLFTGPAQEDLNKIRSYDSLVVMNTQLYTEFKKANTQLININNNFLYQHYMKNVDPKDTITNEYARETSN